MYAPNPITDLGTVWIALYSATVARDIPSATVKEVYEAQNTPHPLDEQEIGRILIDLFETQQIELDDVTPTGAMLFRFKSPSYATP